LIDVLIKELPKYPGLYHKVVPQSSVKRQTKTGLRKTSKRNSYIPDSNRHCLLQEDVSDADSQRQKKKDKTDALQQLLR
jgi:hypothetical protein